MIEQDFFVGIVAVLTGLFVLASAISNSAWVDRFWLSRHLRGTSKSSVSRVIVFVIGLACAGVGMLLLLGFFPSQQHSQRTMRPVKCNAAEKDKSATMWNGVTNPYAALG